MIDRIANALSRRSVLLGLAVSATAATSVGASAAPTENPALLALADELPDLQAAYIAARDDVARIVAEWSPHWPDPDLKIVRYGQDCKTHRGIDGRGIETRWGNGKIMRVQELGTPEYFAESAKHNQAKAERHASTKSQRGMKHELFWAEQDRALIEPARAYWSEVARITGASGIEAAQERLTATREALHSKVDEVMTADDWTITGAFIKAQALGAWAEVDVFWRNFNVRGTVWADQLAASILRHAGAART